MGTLSYDVIIVGAGAAGLMCAIEAGKRGRNVVVLDHGEKRCEKIRISGGGRCNFTNVHTTSANFISANSHFCKSALSRFTPADFMVMLDAHGIGYHEKKLGQMFCNDSAQQVIDMLYKECEAVGASVLQPMNIQELEAIGGDDGNGGGYELKTTRGRMKCKSLVIATGGLSIPKIGATSFGYEIARKFEVNVLETEPALVPLMFQADVLEHCKSLSGVSVEAEVRSADGTMFTEGLLFTHRGLSGPSILQISSYWRAGEALTVNLAPEVDVLDLLKQPTKKDIGALLSDILPNSLAEAICEELGIGGRVAEMSAAAMEVVARRVNAWELKPSGTEGYRTAEVTLRGIDTDELSSKTMEASRQSGLYFIGEVVDVTGHLGGFNFQWAWASGHAAGHAV